jgi:CheY-like chemotaxis protein
VSQAPVTILLVDDDLVDTVAVRRWFREKNIHNPIVEARDGLEALAALRGNDGWERVSRPVLALLDLNMPRMGGIEFLDEIRRDDSLRGTVVFVMTTSSAAEDVQAAYERNVAGYILKHGPGTMFTEAMAMLKCYCRIVEFPEY